MKIVRCKAAGEIVSGVLDDRVVRQIYFNRQGAPVFTGNTVPLDDVVLTAPCVPTKIVAVGLNYRAHARETRKEVPGAPLLFLKPSSAVIGPGDDIILPPESFRVDYEAELGVVIGRRAKKVRAAEYSDYVLGYTCFNDVTARDFQASDGQWTRAKGYDTFAPFGPWIETELDPAGLTVEALLDGKVVQSGNTADLIFSVPYLVQYISNVMTLNPGDIIATGTPEGIGPMADGQKIEISIQGIGVLRNTARLGTL